MVYWDGVSDIKWSMASSVSMIWRSVPMMCAAALMVHWSIASSLHIRLWCCQYLYAALRIYGMYWGCPCDSYSVLITNAEGGGASYFLSCCHYYWTYRRLDNQKIKMWSLIPDNVLQSKRDGRFRVFESLLPLMSWLLFIKEAMTLCWVYHTTVPDMTVDL